MYTLDHTCTHSRLLLKNVITRLLKQGLCVSKLEHIGSNRQPDALELDGDDEGPWQIDWTVSPDHLSNRDIVDRWVDEVIRDKEVSYLVKVSRNIGLPGV